jgi:hypothetical protein
MVALLRDAQPATELRAQAKKGRAKLGPIIVIGRQL